MDENRKIESRRRKILDNAEARLRFIKEGIPWRPTEVLNEVSQTSETDSGLNSPKNEISRSSENLTGEDNLFESAHDRLSDTEVNDVNSRPLPKSDAEKSESFIRQEVDLLEPVETVESNEDITSLEDNEINLKGLTEVSSADFDPKPAAVDDTTQINDSLATQIIETNEASEPPVDPFKALEDLLAESSNERLQHKKKANQLSRNLWISCFIMLCLGIVVRISYSVGLSWIFNEMMLVPFLTVSIPRLVPLMMDPPSPTGTLTNLLIISGIKVSVITKTFYVVTLLRTFFQFFSVYIVSFVFTHQLAESLS